MPQFCFYALAPRVRQRLLFIALLLGVIGLKSAPASAQSHSAAEVIERPYWQHRVDLFQRLPNPEGEIVFLGDSITDGCEWRELTGHSRVTNRGISGDTAWGVMARIEEVTAGRPAQIFFLIGTNDLAHGETVAAVHDKIAAVLDTIRQHTPGTEVYLQSVLPVYGRGDGNEHNERVLSLNDRLADLDARSGVTYVDIATAMRNDEGKLQAQLSADGLHLNGKGYYLWFSVIREHLE
jgi:lysophospholipase L1-like esterase